jgi:hypothetical protein
VRLHTHDKERFAGPVSSEFVDGLPTVRRQWRRAGRFLLTLRVLGAVALLATGAVHLQQYAQFYSEIPTIGTLFVLNFAGATVLALALLAPLERVGGRLGNGLLTFVALAGIALAATAFTFLLISEHTPLFGFQEPGYDPTAIAASRVAEIAAAAFLGLFLAGRFWLKAPMRRWQSPMPRR